jgi:hypothetical protein
MDSLAAGWSEGMRSDAQTKSLVYQVLERFNQLVSTRNLQVLAEFALAMKYF